ncbi:MAG: T9SS type A sorting domain-containing protein [Chitinophagales bacterium]
MYSFFKSRITQTLLVALCFLAISPFAFAQQFSTEITPNGNGGREFLAGSVQGDNGNIVVASTKESFVGSYQAYINQLDANTGNLLGNSQTLNGSSGEIIKDIIRVYDNNGVHTGYALTGHTTNSSGNDLLIVVTDLSGCATCSATFGGNGINGTYQEGNSIIQDPISGDLVAVGFSANNPIFSATSSDVYAVKVNSDCAMFWSRTYTIDALDKGVDIVYADKIPDSAGNPTLPGYALLAEVAGPSVQDVALILINETGNIATHHVIDVDGGSTDFPTTFEYDDIFDAYVVAGYRDNSANRKGFTFRMFADGTMSNGFLWDMNGYYNTIFLDIVKEYGVGSYDYYLAGTSFQTDPESPDGFNRHGMMMKLIDNADTPQWSNVYPDPNATHTYFEDIAYIDGSGLVAVGQIWTDDTTLDYDIYAIGTDFNGDLCNAQCYQSVSPTPTVINPDRLANINIDEITQGDNNNYPIICSTVSETQTFCCGGGGNDPICRYNIPSVNSDLCDPNGSVFEVCLTLNEDLIGSGIIGMDYAIEYDSNIMTPVLAPAPQNVVATLGSVVTNMAGTATYYANDINVGATNQLYLSIAYTTNGMAFDGLSGDTVICLQFDLAMALPTNTAVSVVELEEAYELTEVAQCAEVGTIDISESTGKGVFFNMAQSAPNIFTLLVSELGIGNGIEMFLYEADANCTATSGIIDIVGNYDEADAGYFETTADYVIAERDISPNTNVMAVINALDCIEAARIANYDDANIPSPDYLIAADVNMNDKVRANDITLIQQRIVGLIDEFPQVWNDGTGEPSKDWLFIEADSRYNNPDFTVASNYPVYGASNVIDGGYWRDDVPNMPMCLTAPECSDTAVYYGVLLGDVNGSGESIAYGSGFKTSVGTLNVDIDEAVEVEEQVYDIPVTLEAQESVIGFDFTLSYDADIFNIEAVLVANGETGLTPVYNNTETGQLLVTAFTLGEGISEGNVFYLRVSLTGEELNEADFTETMAFLNGTPSDMFVEGSLSTEPHTPIGTIGGWININHDENGNVGHVSHEGIIAVGPNPATDRVLIDWSMNDNSNNTNKTVAIYDNAGRQVAFQNLGNYDRATSKMEVQHLHAGLYFVVLNDNGAAIARTKLMIVR